jgi:hypothetical protein
VMWRIVRHAFPSKPGRARALPAVGEASRQPG